MTKQPLHLLANSIIGSSLYITPTQDLQYHSVDVDDLEKHYVTDTNCWETFRSGYYFIHEYKMESTAYINDILAEHFLFKTLNITYTHNCAQYQNSTTIQDMIVTPYSGSIGGCNITNIHCTGIGSEDLQCRLNIRMSAALTLTGCLLIKAIYMVASNISARKRIKTHCLTFGDVLVASAKESDLQIRNECLVNAGDGHRHHIQHTCHKMHCLTDSEPSLTGDEIGHCQKCTRFNIINKAADLSHPCLATKYKKSLISNLGSTAVSQMMILMVCSLFMLSISVVLAVSMANEAARFGSFCAAHPHSDVLSYDYLSSDQSLGCDAGLYNHLKVAFGTFGGFQGSGTLSSLPPNSLRSEILTFAISNGAQILYSLLYLLLIYNITLISMERDWGNLERQRSRPRCTLVKGDAFNQSYLLQLPKKVLFPLMALSATMHWLLGQALSTREIIWVNPEYGFDPKYPTYSGKRQEHSVYFVSIEIIFAFIVIADFL